MSLNQKIKDLFANWKEKFNQTEWSALQHEIDEFFPEPLMALKTGKKQKLVFQDYHSLTYQYKAKTDPTFEMYNEQHAGVVTDLVLLSPVGVAANAVFKLLIRIDGRTYLDESFVSLQALSDYLTYVTAETDATYNIVRINTIYFSKSLYIKIYDSTATFTYAILQLVKKLED